MDIPADIKERYRTVWEIKQKNVLQMAADRGPFIDQSQSLNIHVAQPKYGTLTSMHFTGWKMGLKTGMYYLRTKPAAAAIKFTVDKSKVNHLLFLTFMFKLFFKIKVEEKENVAVKIEAVTKSPVKAVSSLKEGPSEDDIRRLNEAALVRLLFWIAFKYFLRFAHWKTKKHA